MAHFTATVERTVRDEVTELQNAVLASVLLLSAQDAKFKQLLLTALQDDNKQIEDVEDSTNSM